MDLTASFNGFSDVPVDLQGNLEHGEAVVSVNGQNVGEIDDEWGSLVRSSMEFRYRLLYQQVQYLSRHTNWF